MTQSSKAISDPVVGSLLQALPPEPPPKPRLTAWLGECEGAGCEIVVHFGQPVIAEAALKTAKPPPIHFTPELEGAFHWRSPTEVTFTPRRALEQGEGVYVSIDHLAAVDTEVQPLEKWSQALTVSELTIAGKVVDWPVVKGHPRLVPWTGTETAFGPNGAVLVFDQPIAPRRLAKTIHLTTDAGEEVPFRATHADAEALSEADVDPDFTLRLVPATRIPDGTTLTLSVPSWEPSNSGLEEVDQKLTYRWVGAMAVSAVGFEEETSRTPDRAPLEGTYILQPTSPIRLSDAQQAVTISPEPEHFSVDAWSQELRVNLRLAPGRKYTLTVSGLVDIYGNRAPRLTVPLQAQDLEPVLDAPSVPVVVERRDARLPIRGTNTGPVTVQVYRFRDTAEFLSRYGATRPESCVGEPIGKPIEVSDRGRLNEQVRRDVPLKGLKGLLCIELDALGRGSEAIPMQASAVMQVSDLAATVKSAPEGLFVWATHLSDATPAARAEVEVLDANGAVLASARTASDGTARVKLPPGTAEPGSGGTVFVSVASRGDTALTEVNNDTLSNAWQFGMPADTGGSMPLYASIFTDRGAYRPGETVHVKAIVRGHGSVHLRISDPRGQALLDRDAKLSELGATDADVVLGEKAAVGAYTVQLSQGDHAAARTFRVEEYRVPTFEVKVRSDDAWRNGATAHASIEAHYLHGGALAGRALKWSVLREPVPFQPAQYSGFTFNYGPRPRAGEVDSAEVKLDGNGRFDVAFQPALGDANGPMRYVLEGTATDLDRQAYSGRVSQVVHPGSFYVGMRGPPSRVLGKHSDLEVPIVAVTPQGEARAGVPVTVSLERIDFHTTARLSGSAVNLSSQPVPNRITACEVITRATPVTCRLSLAEAGLFRVVASALDDGRPVRTGFEVTVAGDNSVAWPRFDQDRISVAADKSSYRIGDVAKLVVQTPFDKARGLLTIERGGVLVHRVFEIDGNTPALEVPITRDLVPNAFVSVVLLRGRVHDQKDATGFETGAPAFKLGYAELKVEPTEQRLSVQVSSDSKIAAPGDSVQLEVHVKDAAGNPAPGEAVLAVVDEAVLGLTGYQTPDPLSALYASRALAVRTAEGRLDLIHARRSRQELIFPGGDGEEEGLRLKLLPGDVRALFQSTAYWNPRLRIGPDGVARVTVKLPDNLTTFRVMAVAYDAHERAGSSETKLVVRKPLMVQPVLPRFAYPGDRFLVEALLFNGTAQDGTVKFLVEGLDGLTARPQARLIQEARVESGRSVKVSLPVEVTGRGTTRVRFRAEMGKSHDDVEVKIPILDAGAKRITVVSLPVNQRETIELPIPAERQPGTTEMEVMVSSTALSELKDSVQALMQYPNGCIEQTTSTAYPLVVLKDLLPDMGVTVDEADLKKFSEAGVKRLLSFQTTSGGLAYWPGSDKPHVFGTTFGLTALIEAKKRGFDVPDEALNRAADFLERSLKQGEITEEMPHEDMPDGDTRALIVLTLNRLGRPQPAYVSTLWREHDKLSPFGVAMLAVTVSEGGGEQSLLQPMLAEVRKYDQEDDSQAWFEGERERGWKMGSPLRTHAAALLAFAGSQVRGDASAKLLRGLLKRKTGYGIWGNTQENVYGIMGVARLVGSHRAPGDGPEATLSLGDRTVPMSQLETVSSTVRRFVARPEWLGVREGQAGVAKVTLEKSGGPPTFLNARLKYEVPLTGKNRDARSEGFEIARRYETTEGKPLDGKPIPLGSVVRVRVRVKSAAKQNYVAIDDKLPAGLEPLNTNLATTERVSMGEATPELTAGLQWLSFQETRDSRVAFFADELPAGTYEYVYLARATTPGHFLRPPASVEAMYAPEVNGASSIDEVEIVTAAGRRGGGR